VEGVLTDALAAALRAPGVRIVCAGRTDAGVHAIGQSIHFDAGVPVADVARLQRSLNGQLPPSVRVRDLRPAEPGFDARFSALWRRYRYRVTDAVPDPLQRREVLASPRVLDAGAMDRAAAALVGEHDFGSFCRPRPGATTVREVRSCTWRRRPDGVLELEVVADAFCHSMVRSIVGASLEVGRGRRDPSWMAGLLAHPSRLHAAPVAAPHGLAPDQYAARARAARRRRGDAGDT
jgi:tRNA pseudouridine38-40 synthase